MKPATKSLNLPKPVADYFTADKADGEAGRSAPRRSPIRPRGIG